MDRLVFQILKYGALWTRLILSISNTAPLNRCLCPQFSVGKTQMCAASLSERKSSIVFIQFSRQFMLNTTNIIYYFGYLYLEYSESLLLIYEI